MEFILGFGLLFVLFTVKVLTVEEWEKRSEKSCFTRLKTVFL